jgi:hypothetical protein
MRSPRDELDKLITWYEKFKPSAGQVIQINRHRDDIITFCSEDAKGDLWYRNRIIVPIGTKPATKGTASRRKGLSMREAFRKVWS